MRFRLPMAGLLGLAVLAAGCGSSSEPVTSGKVAISYAIWDKNDQASAEKIIAAFQQANPNVTVKLEITPGTSTGPSSRRSRPVAPPPTSSG